MMVVHSMGNTHEVTAEKNKNLLAVRILVAVLNMILHDLDKVVKPGYLNPLAGIFGVDLQSLMKTVQKAMYLWGEHVSVDELVGWVSPNLCEIAECVSFQQRELSQCDVWHVFGAVK